ncbi:conserved hypothetical protein [Nitrosopumilaceae archaeon]|nr:aconitase X catalytic domain-containing protein [Nitrosopumilus sp.]MDA7954228.1 aconitase X catalytic domain-containing protein [Nitrosopumilus sp.]MDA7973176.1 aconitase X catalytic domain-containing protein [Nitrosopumilus sp.]CAI9832548.1 conserved hypothetical protein [Nitrosopumilaceae archaeon]
MELTRDEEEALAGGAGEAEQAAYRILVAAGEAAGAERLVPVSWAHLSGVNYNTIGPAGERFLADMARTARFRIRATVNPMGYDRDSVDRYGLPAPFIEGQESIARSYGVMGAEPSFTCAPYDVLDMPAGGGQVALAESNAAIHANSFDNLHTNKESSFTALASAITGKSPLTPLRGGAGPDAEVRVRMDDPDELECGLLGYFAGRVGRESVRISGLGAPDRRRCKALCGGMGTSGTCAKIVLGEGGGDCEAVDFGREEARAVRDELDTADGGDAIVLGSPQLGPQELADLAARVGGRRFTKRCIVFCPRAARGAATDHLEAAGCEVLSDCCACLSPLITKEAADSVITNSVKGAYYLNAGGVRTDLEPLSEILRGYLG